MGLKRHVKLIFSNQSRIRNENINGFAYFSCCSSIRTSYHLRQPFHFECYLTISRNVFNMKLLMLAFQMPPLPPQKCWRSLWKAPLGSNETSLVEDWLNMYLGNGANFVCAIPSQLSSSRYYYDWVYILWTMANLLPRSKYFPFFLPDS